MARGNTWTNADGLEIGFERRDSINKEDAVVHTLGRKKQAEIIVDHTNIASFADAVAAGSKAFQIPAGSIVTGGEIHVSEAFNLLTSLTVGLKQADGTTDDPDGILLSELLAGLTLDAVHPIDGAYLDAVTAEDLVLSVTVVGTAPTAGVMKVLIEYREPTPSQASPAIITGVI